MTVQYIASQIKFSFFHCCHFTVRPSSDGSYSELRNPTPPVSAISFVLQHFQHAQKRRRGAPRKSTPSRLQQAEGLLCFFHAAHVSRAARVAVVLRQPRIQRTRPGSSWTICSLAVLSSALEESTDSESRDDCPVKPRAHRLTTLGP